MPPLTRVMAGLRGLFRKQRREQELDDELRDYLENATEQKMLAGLTREDAQRAARVEMGSLDAVKERVRDVWWESLVHASWHDLRNAIRTLRRSPGVAAVVVLTLALGIGANTAIFSVVNSLMLRSLPVVEPQRLVTISSSTEIGGSTAPWTYAIWEQIRPQAHLFDGALAWSSQRFDLAQGGETQPADGLFASGDFFTTLGVPALLGRTLSPADDVPGGGPDGPVAVISYGLWQRRFGGNANVIGTPLVVERIPFTIVGVTPPEFFGTEVGRAFDVAVPLATERLIRGKDTFLDVRRAYWLTVMLRLKRGQSLDAATATLRAVQPRIREGAMPAGGPARAQQEFLSEPFSLVPAAGGTSALRQRYERSLLTILVVVGLVLLIACANIANLLIARAAARRHEMSLRLALGASRGRLARQLLVESLVLAGAGAMVGLIFAVWASRALVAQLSTSVNRVVLDLALDGRVVAFTAAVAIATALAFGIAPAFQATRREPIDALKEQGRPARGPGPRGLTSLSSTLVVAQIAVSLMLVVGAGLFVGTFARLASVPLGFDRDRILVVGVDVTRAQVNPANRMAFYHRLVEAVAAVPGVSHAAGSSITPVSGSSTRFPVDVSGAAPMSERDRFVRANAVTPGWFATYGTAIRSGRDIDGRDTTNALPVVLVNEAFTRRFFPHRNPIGETVTPLPPPGSGDAPVPKIVVGVVSDAVYRSPREGVEPTVYMPMAQAGPRGSTVSISVRSAAGSPVSIAPSVAAALTAVDRDLAFSFRPLADQVNASLAQERLVALLSGFFGGLALLLAGLGLYGVTAYAVTRRRSEIGIRMALGAQRSDVIALVMSRTVLTTGAGIVFGLAGAAAVTRYLEGMLYGLTPLDAATFLTVALMFAAVALIAAFIPVRRATKVDPLIALRCE